MLLNAFDLLQVHKIHSRGVNTHSAIGCVNISGEDTLAICERIDGGIHRCFFKIAKGAGEITYLKTCVHVFV